VNAEAEEQRRVWAVVLAAGQSSRYGSSKLLETFRDETLVARAVRAAREACGARVLLVVGHDAERIARAAARHAPEVLVNRRFAEGIGSSLAAATDCLAARAEALLVTLGDQPLVSAGHLHKLLDRWDGSRKHIVATVYGATTGVPALLPGGCFNELRGLEGDRGAQRLFDDPRFSLATVRNDAAAFDVDVPGDLARLYRED
jgi:molybdenum cofactor cytidylyltransferase